LPLAPPRRAVYKRASGAKGIVMSVFMVQRSLQGIPMDQLAAAQQRAIATADQMRSSGEPVRYIRSAFVPETGQCMCLFDAQNAEQVEKLNRTAGIPFDRVVPALDLSPPNP
jgi:hypothetical protein